MVKSRGLWNMGIGSLALVVLLWILKAVDVLAAQGIFYAVFNPIGALCLMCSVYLLVLGAGQALVNSKIL